MADSSMSTNVDKNDPLQLSVYIVRNQEGKYCRTKGYGGYGSTWVDDILKAKVYTKLSGARTRVGYFANAWPQYGVPSIIKLMVTEVEVLDEADRVAKSREDKRKKKLAREASIQRAKLRHAQESYDRAKKELDKLKIRE
jgi:hypothetical protein